MKELKKQIWNEISRKIQEENISLNEISRRANISRNSIEALRKSKNYNIDTLLKVCEVIEAKISITI